MLAMKMRNGRGFRRIDTIWSEPTPTIRGGFGTSIRILFPMVKRKIPIASTDVTVE